MSLTKKMTSLTMIVFIIMNFVLSMSSVIFNSILDKMALSLNIPLSQTGYLTSFYAIGAGIGVPIFLIVFRKQSQSLLLKVTLALNIVATALILVAPNYLILLLTRFMMGLMGNCYGVLATAIIASMSPKNRVGKNLALLITGAASALMIGIPLTRLLINYYPWQYIFIILILLMVLSLIYFIINIPDYESHNKQLDLKAEWNIMKQKSVSMVLMASIVTFVGYGGFYTYMTPYLIHQFPNLESYMSVLLIVIGACTVVGNLLGGIVCDRLGYHRSLCLSTCFQIVVSLALFMTRNYSILNIVFVLIWMANAWFIGLQFSTGITVVTHHKSHLMISLNGSGVQLGQAIGTSIASMMIVEFGISTIMIVSTVSSAIVMAVLLMNHQNDSLEQEMND